MGSSAEWWSMPFDFQFRRSGSISRTISPLALPPDSGRSSMDPEALLRM